MVHRKQNPTGKMVNFGPKVSEFFGLHEFGDDPYIPRKFHSICEQTRKLLPYKLDSNSHSPDHRYFNVQKQ
jgi:hypothetical protein